jgi:hypothetical protein
MKIRGRLSWRPLSLQTLPGIRLIIRKLKRQLRWLAIARVNLIQFRPEVVPIRA